MHHRTVAAQVSNFGQCRALMQPSQSCRVLLARELPIAIQHAKAARGELHREPQREIALCGATIAEEDDRMPLKQRDAGNLPSVFSRDVDTRERNGAAALALCDNYLARQLLDEREPIDVGGLRDLAKVLRTLFSSGQRAEIEVGQRHRPI